MFPQFILGHESKLERRHGQSPVSAVLTGVWAVFGPSVLHLCVIMPFLQIASAAYSSEFGRRLHDIVGIRKRGCNWTALPSGSVPI